MGAYHGYKSGGIPGAVFEGALGAAGGPVLGKMGQVLRAGKALRAVAPVAEAAAAAAPVAKAATVAAEAAPVATAALKVVPATVAGEKIWAVVDAVGTPVQTFTNAAKALQYAHEAKRAASAVTTAAEVAPVVAKVVQVAPVAATVAKAVEATPAAVTAARHSALVQFAKDAVARNPKLGEKIWVALDKAGNPVKILTPDQAGAAKRAGIATTWVRNLWR
jgi:hypothetical protein